MVVNDTDPASLRTSGVMKFSYSHNFEIVKFDMRLRAVSLVISGDQINTCLYSNIGAPAFSIISQFSHFTN